MSFFADLLGKSSAKAAQQLGQRNASQINSGYGQADTYARQGYDASQARYEPYASQGQAGFTRYNDALGLNGDQARTAAYQSFESDPFMAYARQNSGNEINNIFRRYGARGMANSGAAGLAVSRAAGERAQSDVNNWLSRLQGVGQQGLGIANAQAGLDQGYYGGMADRALGRTNALVNNDSQATMAANNARMSGVNNLLKIGGMAANIGMAGMGGGMGRAVNALGGMLGGRSDDGAGDLGGTYYLRG